jgi:hypothetical protein
VNLRWTENTSSGASGIAALPLPGALKPARHAAHHAKSMRSGCRTNSEVLRLDAWSASTCSHPHGPVSETSRDAAHQSKKMRDVIPRIDVHYIICRIRV